MNILLTLGLAMLGQSAPSSTPTPNPTQTIKEFTTRESMLGWLQASTKHEPRLPLPKPSADDLEKAKSSPLGLVNNSLMRRYYLPADWAPAAFPPRTQQTGLVDYAFKTELFWIISRLNQCAYCLGHQEAKLSTAGLSEAQIAALDDDWASLDTATRAARELAVWKTLTPHLPVPEPIWRDLQTRFSADQINEILLSIANYNAMNRWTGPLNIPQEPHRNYTSQLPVATTRRTSQLRARAQKFIGKPRSLPDANTWLSGVHHFINDPSSTPTPTNGKTSRPTILALLNSQGLLGSARLKSWNAALQPEPVSGLQLPPLLRGQILWLCARLDNAPQAAAPALKLLNSLGQQTQSIQAIEDFNSTTSAIDPKHRAALALARQITLDPGLVSADDIARVRTLWGDHATAQIIELSAIAAAINRLNP